MTHPWQGLAGALLLFGALALAPGSAWAQETQHGANAPDFSAVTTKAAAIRLARQGELVRIRPFPAELGGPSDPENIVYIPPAVEEARQLLIGTLRRFTDQDLIDQPTSAPSTRAKASSPRASIIPPATAAAARRSRQ